ncbi:MAG: ABC transporter permease [Thermoproteales archaeon]|nr:ABC transporter permease [Thermoproteales archaeon]
MNLLFLKFSLKMALRNMAIHRLRTLLTILAVTWSVATLVALRTVGIGMRSVISQQIGEFLQADIIIAEDTIVIPQHVAEDIKKIPHVKEAVGAILIPAKIERYKGTYLFSIPIDKIDFFKITLLEKDKNFSSNDVSEIIIDYEVAEEIGKKKIGSTLTLVISFGTVYMEDRFRIVNMMTKKSFLSGMLGTSFSLVPLGRIQEILGKKDFINYIFIRLDDKKYLNDVVKELRKLYPGINILKQTDIIKIADRILSTVDGTLMMITIIGLMVAALGVTNTVMMSIRERIREIGVLKAIGANDKQILQIFLNEILILGIMGGILGDITGYFGSYFLRNMIKRFGVMFDVPIRLYPQVLVLGFIIAVSVAVLSAFYPVYRAIRIRPIEALKYE